MSKRFTILFWLAVGLQIIVIVAVFGFHQTSSFLGEDVLLKLSAPKDPLSLFQGHYLILNYEISNLDLSKMNLDNLASGLRFREDIYVELEEQGGYWRAVSVSKTKPKEAVFIKGEAVFGGFSRGSGIIAVNYGIEKYFISEKDWQKTEDILRKATIQGTAYVEVNISPFTHKGSVKKIFIDGEEFKVGKSLSKLPPGKSYSPQSKAKDARIISALSQSRTIMVYIYANDNNYDNFSCQHPDQAQLCLEISNMGGSITITKDPAINSRSVCAFSTMNNPETSWYCVDSTGRAGFTAVDPGRTGYCLNGKSAVCPPLVGEEEQDIPALQPVPQVFETGAVSATGQATASEKESKERSIKIISPNGGETFCLGETINIRWQSEKVKAMEVRLVQVFSNRSSWSYILTSSTLADSDDSGVPGQGLFPWKVGSSEYHKDAGISEGVNYKIEIFSKDGEEEVSDKSDDFFTIMKCEG